MLGYLSLGIISFSELTVSLKLHSRKTVRFSEQIMSVYKNLFNKNIEAEINPKFKNMLRTYPA